MVAVGADAGQEWDIGGEVIKHLEHIHVALCRVGHSLNMLHGIQGAADGQNSLNAVGKCARRQDIPRFQILVHHLQNSAACGADRVPHCLAVSQHRRRTRQTKAQSLACHMHGVGGTDPLADAGALDGRPNHLLHLLVGDLTYRFPAGLDKQILDVKVLALVCAAGLIAAGDDDGGNITPGGCHQLSRQGFVTGGQADHAVQIHALHCRLNIIRDQVPAAQGIAVFMAGIEEIHRGRGAYLEGKAASLFHLLSRHFGDLIKMAEADSVIGGGIDNGNFGFEKILFRLSQSIPHGFPDGNVVAIAAILFHDNIILSVFVSLSRTRRSLRQPPVQGPGWATRR